MLMVIMVMMLMMILMEMLMALSARGRMRKKRMKEMIMKSIYVMSLTMVGNLSCSKNRHLPQQYRIHPSFLCLPLVCHLQCELKLLSLKHL